MALNGKIAVVTGAAMGIGKAVSEIFLQNGAKVVLLDVDQTSAESLMETLHKQYGKERVMFLCCNVESEEQVKAAFQKTVDTFGGIDILCNNAGIMNEVSWEKMVSINLMGVIRGTYLGMEHMNKLKGGRGGVIINTGSLAGLGPLICCPVYTATKYGVVGFTRAMAGASGESGFGVRVNTVCPVFVQTNLLTSLEQGLGTFSNLTGVSKKLVEKFSILSVSDVAEAFLELATNETKNGEALMVLSNERKYMPFPNAI